MSVLTPEQLREWRNNHNFKQEELAKTLGVTGQAIRNWEAGRRAIPSFLRLALVGILTEQEAAQ